MNIIKKCLRSNMETQNITTELKKSGERQFSPNSIIILWIQNTPNTNKTVLSRNGAQISSDTGEYDKLFKNLTSQSLDKYSVLTISLKRLSLCNVKHRLTFLSGHFEQKDKSNRRICYRALIIDAKDKEEECLLLVQESNLYGCSISEEDKIALKKKSIVFKFIVITLIIILILLIWILNTLKMLSYFNMMN